MSGSYHLTLAGVVSDEQYHKCLACIKELTNNGCCSNTVMEFFPTQWDAYLKELQNTMKGEFYNHKGSPVVYLNGQQYIGGCEQFVNWAMHEFRYTDATSSLIYKKLAADAYRKAINETPNRSYVQLKINTGAAIPSTVVIELFEDICPKTCENFKQLCKSFKPQGGQENISYASTEVSRCVKGMYI